MTWHWASSMRRVLAGRVRLTRVLQLGRHTPLPSHTHSSSQAEVVWVQVAGEDGGRGGLRMVVGGGVGVGAQMVVWQLLHLMLLQHTRAGWATSGALQVQRVRSCQGRGEVHAVRAHTCHLGVLPF
jgi:hypothetical protein